eukprot:TRINITY_DN444_c0_g1_i1.p1 TRINITY_DN444_c0_g1~~TRINITY_DN444_c0_g1_i1.p1  ORF type:complete len:754 (+),score=165.39 TRINITY_DN444_c0_g1_i1:340-2262(+)
MADKLEANDSREIKHYVEFWRTVASTEPYRVVLSDVRDKLYRTRDRAQQLLVNGKTDIPEADTYSDKEQLLEVLEVCYRSLCETGDKEIADGTLLDFMRQVACFGMALVRLDIRQESERHTDVLDAITVHLGIGSYRSWSEEERVAFLVKELKSKRPLFGADLTCSSECREVLETFKVIADIPRSSFGAYIISMATSTSDVLAVELLQRECGVLQPLRVVPLFERLDDLTNGAKSLDNLFAIDWYQKHLKNVHNMQQEVMIGYSDSGKDAGRLSAAWAMFKAQVEMANVGKKYEVKLTMFHGRGGTVGRGGGPTHLAILSQPPGTINGSLRVTIQGEVIEQTFGEGLLCFRSLQRFTAATLEHGMNPPRAPLPEWAQLMDEMSVVATDDYRSIVFKEPRFVEYFRKATPEMEYGRMNIGSRPSKRRQSGGIETLRAIPWIFAWTQTRFHLPVWLGVGAALTWAIEKDPKNLDMLKEMYKEWPFFRVTIDLLEMVFAKGDPRIAKIYDRLLVDEPLRPFGEMLRERYETTKKLLLLIAGHEKILDGNPYLRQRLLLREPYITPLNIQQAITLKKMREEGHQFSVNTPRTTPRHSSSEGNLANPKSTADVVLLNRTSEFAPGLEDTLIITMKGIAAGMQNTG